MSARLAAARRIVIKIGSSLLVAADGADPNQAWLASLAADVAQARARGQKVAIVSSGAVALGRRVLGLRAGILRLEEKQAAAAAGQARLIGAYEQAFAQHGAPVAQALLTAQDAERRRAWLNARATLETLLSLGAVPIINENDTVATAEIRYGDNDRLAARAAQMIGADVLILLSDVDGLYTADPRRDQNAQHLPELRALDQRILDMAGPPDAAGPGTGGMRTKLDAVRIAWSAGCATIICRGADPADPRGPLSRLAAGARATWFLPALAPEDARRQWIVGHLRPDGALILDDGAIAALQSGASLLPVGVRRVEGKFARGDAVILADATGRAVGKGVSAYDCEDARRIIGKQTAEVEAILGFRGRPALVHRDDLVLDVYLMSKAEAE